ncbi:hypothetical protein L195_g047221, partial [Trifolium pratense]
RQDEMEAHSDNIEDQIDAIHADEMVYSPDLQVECSERIQSWQIVVSRAIWSGKKHIPRHIVKNCFREDQQEITLVNEDKDLIYHYAELGIGDTLCLTVSVPPDFVEATVIKREVLPL